MKCTYCQTEYDDSLGYCPACQVNGSPENFYQAQNNGYAPTAVELIRKIGSGRMFLIATIIYTAASLISFISSGEAPLVNILMAVGLWMFYAECAKKNADPYVMSTTPFKIMNVAQTIIYVICWIGAVAMALCTLLFVAVYGDLKSQLGALSFLIDALIVIFVILTLVLVSEIILRKGIKNYIKSASESASTGLRPQKLSKFTPVFIIVYAIIGAVSVIVMNIVVYLFIENLTDLLIKLASSFMSVNNQYISFESSIPAVQASSLSVFSVINSIFTALLPIAAELMFALVLLDAKKLSDSSYYPTQDELFYQRQAYYYYKNQAQYAQNTQTPYQAQPQYQQIPYSAPQEAPMQSPAQAPGEAPAEEPSASDSAQDR